MARYTLKTNAYVQKVSGKKLKDAEPSIFYRRGETVNGGEYYIVLGKQYKRVVKLANNKYLPFEDIVDSEAKSGLILPPTVMTAGIMQEDLSYVDGNGGLTAGSYPLPNNIAVEEWARTNKMSYSNIGGGGEDETKVVELTPEQVKEQHKASGSTKPFNEWLKSGAGKDWLISFGSQLSDLLSGKKPTSTIAPAKPSGSSKPDKKKVEILGMHPVTFTVVTLLTVGAIGMVVMSVKSGKPVPVGK